MPTDLRKARELFLHAVGKLPAEQWDGYVAEACGEDADLAQQVGCLFQVHREAGSFLDAPAPGLELPGTSTVLYPRLAEGPGTLIGPYKLLQQIGEGGMGVVFMAEQTEPIQRTVALKIIKPGMDTRQVIARFEAERQAVAMMDHPNIAKVLDAGTTDSGRPYFVMELVKGVPITKYCDEKLLPLRARLELFVQVCQAVQHAHQKGIIHRDLKPNNVLVAEYDNHAVPKVIDFGVAKATAQKLTERTMFTEFGQVLGTMEYMSPEQSKFNQLDIDTRSDIYSLGVLLYELLAGSTPFEGKRLHAAAFDEMLRIIREEEPPKPSTRLSSLRTTSDSLPLAGRAGEGVPSSLASIAANRHTEPARLSKDVRGELDWIVMKALEKDRNRRYETASGFAADIERHLHDEPVEAGPPSRMYRMTKFIRRNKAGVVAGSAIFAALAIGLTLATTGFIHARRQAEIARTEAARSAQVAQFIKDMLAAAGPGVARGRDATLLREILDKTAERVGKDLNDQPAVQGDLWFTLGTTYHDIGDIQRAVDMLQSAVESYRLAFGDENIKLALALGHLGRCQSFDGNVAAGKTNALLGLEIARNCGDSETLATCLLNTARSFTFAKLSSLDGVPLLREAVALRRQLGNDPVALATCIHWLAASLDNSRGAEKESLAREALALHRQQLGPDHPLAVDDLFVLGQVLLIRNELEEAETVLRKSIDLYRKVHDQNHPYQSLVLRTLCGALMLRGKPDEAEEELRRAVETYPSNAVYPALLGCLYANRSDWPAAIPQLSRAVELNPSIDENLFHLNIALLLAGEHKEYRRRCRTFLERVADSQESHDLDMAAKAALLLPVNGPDFDRACQMADRVATATDPSDVLPWFSLCKSIAEFRRSRFKSAIDWASRAISGSQGAPECKAASLFIQSAAYAQLQRTKSAHAAFSKGDELVNEREEIDRDPLGSWQDWAIAELLRREAAALLGVEQPPVTASGLPDNQAPNTNQPAPASGSTTDN